MKLKYVVNHFAFYDSAGLIEKCEQMALSGFRLKKVSYFFLTFEKVAPQPLKYNVVYISRLDSIDPKMTGDYLDFEKVYQPLGWKVATFHSKRVILYHNDSNVNDLELNDDEKFKKVKKSTVKYIGFLFGLFASLLLTFVFLSLINQVYNRNILSLYADNGALFFSLTILFIVIYFVSKVINYIVWTTKAKHHKWPKVRHNKFLRYAYWVMACVLCLWVGLSHDYSGRIQGFLIVVVLSFLMVFIATAILNRVNMKDWSIDLVKKLVLGVSLITFSVLIRPQQKIVREPYTKVILNEFYEGAVGIYDSHSLLMDYHEFYLTSKRQVDEPIMVTLVNVKQSWLLGRVKSELREHQVCTAINLVDSEFIHKCQYQTDDGFVVVFDGNNRVMRVVSKIELNEVELFDLQQFMNK